jgi:uncharacterized membrane protein (DUF4010 family)
MIENFVLFQKIVLSLAIGALIGIEREKRGRGELPEGLRTFMLVCLFGVLSGLFSDVLKSTLPFFAAFFTVGGLTIMGYMAKKRRGHMGLTTEMAFLCTFAIGILIFFESYPYFISISLGVLLTFILIFKELLHRFAKHLKIKEIRDAIIFAILTFIILPLLPNRTVDPFNALNPFVIWLSLVLVLSISFVGYIAIRIFGVKMGLFLTGLFGGLASSTAVAVSMAENVRKSSKILYSATFAVIIASSTMFLRTVFISSVVNYNIGHILLIPFTILAFGGYLLSYLSWRKSRKEKAVIEIGSPLALKQAVKFSIFFILILLFSKLAQNHFGQAGIFLIAAIAGLADVDAASISFSSLALATLSPFIAIKGIIIACLSNTLSKWFLVKWFGTNKMFVEVGKVFVVLLIFGTFMLSLLIF